MGKSSVYQVETNDASQVQGLAAVRGNDNTVNLLDGEAIKQSMLFATSNADGTAKTYAQMVGMLGTVADKAFQLASENSRQTLATLGDSGARSINAIQDAYAKSENSGMKPETLLLIVAALAAVVLIAK